MKYLSNYKIFLEEKEETETTNQTTEDPKNSPSSLGEPQDIEKISTSKEQRNTSKNTSSGNTSKNTSSGNTVKQTGDMGGLKALLEGIVNKINDAFDHKKDNDKYFFRIHSGGNLWDDDETDASISFCGKTPYCYQDPKKSSIEGGKTGFSWWCRNVVSPILNFTNKKGYETPLKYMESLKDDELKKDFQQFINPSPSIPSPIWKGIKKAIEKQEHYSETFIQIPSINIDGDFGVGSREKELPKIWDGLSKGTRDFLNIPEGEEKKLTFTDFEGVLMDHLKNTTKNFNINTTENQFFEVLSDIIILFQILFMSEGTWIAYEGNVNDKDQEASDYIEKISKTKVQPILIEFNKKVIDSSLSKKIKEHLILQSSRIYNTDNKNDGYSIENYTDKGFIGSIIHRMRKSFGAFDVEFRITSFSTNRQVYVHFSTDF